MLKYVFDTITKQGKDYIVYIHVMDEKKTVQTVSLMFRDKEDFKKILKIKTVQIKAEYDEKEVKKAEVEQALKEMI